MAATGGGLAVSGASVIVTRARSVFSDIDASFLAWNSSGEYRIGGEHGAGRKFAR
jgi:hypothetical protein